MKGYVNKLIEFPAMRAPDFARSVFTLGLEEIGESWRRFYHEQQRFPFVILQLADLSHEDFMKEYRQLQIAERSCANCVDLEFSTLLLSYIPETEDCNCHDVKEKVLTLQRFLQDVAVWCPISADLVECLHGACQSRLHRFRGTKPTDAIAKEIVILDKITSAYSKFKDYMWTQLGDPKAFRRLESYGRCDKGNQYTVGTLEGSRQFGGGASFAQLEAKHGTFHGRAARAPRKVCGYLTAFQPELVKYKLKSSCLIEPQ